MKITHTVGKFLVNTELVYGDDSAETYMTLVTRDGSYYAFRTSHNSRHAFDNHMEMCRFAGERDAELSVREAQLVESFKAEGLRLDALMRRLTSHA